MSLVLAMTASMIAAKPMVLEIIADMTIAVVTVTHPQERKISCVKSYKLITISNGARRQNRNLHRSK